MKKFFSVFLCMSLIVCIFAGCSSKGNNDNKGDGNNKSSSSSASDLDCFEIIDGQLIGLTEKGAKKKELVIPESVTSVETRAFAIDEYGESNNVLEKVSFENPNCKLSINSFAYSYSLKEVILPENLTEIPEGCFANCGKLKSIEIPSSVTVIGRRAFDENFALETVNFKGAIVSIGEEAFSECTSLKTLEFQEGLESIGDYAFADCKSITSVTLPQSVTSIEAGAFSNAYDKESEYKIVVHKGSWADTNFDSYKSGDENVQKVYA